MKYAPGMKVVLKGREKFGFAEIESYSENNEQLQVSYYSSPVDKETLAVDESELSHGILPHQTRCFAFKNSEICYGRIIVCQNEGIFPRCYYIKWPNIDNLENLDEDSFKVKAYYKNSTPLNVLSEYSYETPFFFAQRYNLIKAIYKQNQLCEGLLALPSSKIEFFDHQVEVARKILQDPIIRYLLADEVGLGKTIEAGLILKQITLDWNNANIYVFVPKTLVNQWKEELAERFGLSHIPIHPHESMEELTHIKPDMIVIDEAHRIVTTDKAHSNRKKMYAAAKILAHEARHLLLLSATPVLNRDSDLLALLHLLDPKSYRLNGLAKLQSLLKMRQKLGKSLLALSRAQLPLLIRRHAARLKQILNTDKVVDLLVEKIVQSDDGELMNHSNALEAHISESYRLNRRMIRNRRSKLSEEFGVGERKVFEQRREYAIDEDTMSELWGFLENWRIETAATADDQEYYANLYINIAQAMAFDHGRLNELLIELSRTTEPSVQREIIDNMLEALSNLEEDSNRISLLCMFLQGRLNRDPESHKHVVFCSDASIVEQIGKRLEMFIEPDLFETITVENETAEFERALQRFRNEEGCRFLIADTVIEEGINLQFAEGFILFDLPWDPMRIEQRFGRLDRINRIHDIPCWILLSSEDDSLAFDEVWCEVLKNGFGVFENSLSDIQFLIDRKMPELTQKVYQGGPEAISAIIKDLKKEIAIERELISEQDIIDGLRLTEDVRSNLRENLDNVDLEAKSFSKSLKYYLEKNLKFRLWWGEDNIFTYIIDDEPLLPVLRLEQLIRDLNFPTTHNRELANKKKYLQLLRPGCSAMESIRNVLSWDDRGKVFAMWREAKNILEPTVIFRVVIKIELDKTQLDGLYDISGWDHISQNGLLRLILSWLPQTLLELFLDENKKPASDELKQLCVPIYNSHSDINLGGQRSEYLRSLFEGKTWPDLCRNIDQESQSLIEKCDTISDMKNTALTNARRHFNLLFAQLEARMNSGIEGKTTIFEELEEQQKLYSTILELIDKPKLSIDSIGVYVLSETPFWEIE